jgi:quinolinate synthase
VLRARGQFLLHEAKALCFENGIILPTRSCHCLMDMFRPA